MISEVKLFDNMLLVFKKEFRAYFQSKIAWVIAVVYSLLTIGVCFFQNGFINYQEPEMASFFITQFSLMLFIIPALTMRLWTEEKRIGTLELTLSLPISYTALTLGKFLASFAICGLMELSTIGVWISYELLSDANGLQIMANYLILMLVCGSLCAVCLAVSVFCSQPVSAFIVSLAVCLLIAMVNTLNLAVISNSEDVLLRIENSVNFQNHFAYMIYGKISLSGVLYFVSLTVFALWINVVSIGWRRN